MEWRRKMDGKGNGRSWEGKELDREKWVTGTVIYPTKHD